MTNHGNTLGLADHGDGPPLVWPAGNRIPLADALCPIVVAALTGRKPMQMQAVDDQPRLVAAGSIGHTLGGSGAVLWGTGGETGRRWKGIASVLATRGPLSFASAPQQAGSVAYGDPAWLIADFYRPPHRPSWELGVVIEDDRDVLGNGLSDTGPVRLIHAQCRAAPLEIRRVLDEMLGCRRLLFLGVSGAIIGESYGIPGLALVAGAGPPCLRRLSVAPESGLPATVVDLYAGLRVSTLPAFVHEPGQRLNAEAAIRAIDTAWNPVWLREEDLLSAFPLPLAPVATRPDLTIFDTEPVSDIGADPLPTRNTAAQRAEAPSLQAWVDENGSVPLAWAATSAAAPYPNLGDALSAVIVATISGLPVSRRNFDHPGERLVGVGTVGHAQRNGIAHFWGTGLDPRRNAFDPSLRRFEVPPDTRLVAHALRGRYSAATLREAGIVVPPVYGDPVSFLPKLCGGRPVEPRYELGVVLHITELSSAAPDAGPLPGYRRYEIPPSLSGAIRLINTYTANDTASLLARVDEIRSCRRIASTSFHGLVIPESFGIPNLWFSLHPGEGMMLPVDNPDVPIDHRLRDWFSGTSRRYLPAYGNERHLPTQWDRLIRDIDQLWERLVLDLEPLFHAFPLRHGVRFESPEWTLGPGLTEQRY